MSAVSIAISYSLGQYSHETLAKLNENLCIVEVVVVVEHW